MVVPEIHSDDVSGDSSMVLRRPSPRTVLAALSGVFGVLLVLDVLGQISGLESAKIINLDGEITVGTWWASIQLALASVVLLFVARRDSLLGRRAAVRALLLGAAATMYFSIDETAGVHELLSKTLGDRNVPGFNNGSGVWLFLYTGSAILVLTLAIPGIASLLKTDMADAIRFAVGAGMLVFGGVIVEISGFYRETHIEVIIEETFEFLGVAVMIWAAYRMLATTEIQFRRA
ncbi:MAG: hypothetical protein BMS9Abin17_0386 [Acidimicrobiia bacterium]|nr:MAG: hypothetical protein BMS9Abin17_0386 [Acidimicrobiia bacterium]